MAWQTPKTDWSAPDGVSNVDMNRIEGNILEVYEMAQADVSTGFGTIQYSTTTTVTRVAAANVAKEVVVQADPTNTNNVLIGDSTTTCTFALLPGSAISLPINNTNLVYYRSAAGSQKLNILWRG